MLQFSCRFAFLSTFKPDTENNTHFDAVSNKCAKLWWGAIF